MTSWIIGTVAIGGVLFLISLFFLIKDNQTMAKKSLSGTYIIPNISLIILSLVWIGLAVYLYFNVQAQLSIVG